MLNVTVAPETGVFPEIEAKLALKVTGALEPNVIEAGLGGDRVSMVARGAVTPDRRSR